jgi:hypothetical protein
LRALDMFVRKLLLVFLSVVLALIYFFLISEDALLEDAYSYYTIYKIDNLDFANSIDALTDRLLRFNQSAYTELGALTLSGLNAFAFFYFGLFGSLDFWLFSFVNMFALILFSFFLINRISRAQPFKIFFMLLSLPMIVNIHFTWRQFLAQIVALGIIFSAFKMKTFFVFLVGLLVHPTAILNLTERYSLVRRFRLVNRLLLILLSGFLGFIVARFTTIASISESSFSLDFRTAAWASILVLYFYPLLRTKHLDLKVTNFFIVIPMIVSYFAFSYSVLGLSRLVALACFSALVFGLVASRNNTNYYALLGPLSFVPYVFFYR